MHNQVVDDEGWEARMAQRAAALRALREAKQRVADAELDAERDRLIERLLADRTWLHGWPVKEGGAVWMGNGSHCLGCGAASRDLQHRARRVRAAAVAT